MTPVQFEIKVQKALHVIKFGFLHIQMCRYIANWSVYFSMVGGHTHFKSSCDIMESSNDQL